MQVRFRTALPRVLIRISASVTNVKPSSCWPSFPYASATQGKIVGPPPVRPQWPRQRPGPDAVRYTLISLPLLDQGPPPVHIPLRHHWAIPCSVDRAISASARSWTAGPPAGTAGARQQRSGHMSGCRDGEFLGKGVARRGRCPGLVQIATYPLAPGQYTARHCPWDLAP